MFPNSTWINGFIQIVTTGGFGALLWYMLVKHIPNIEQRHRDERKEWLAYIKEQDDEQKERDQRYNEELKEREREMLSALAEFRQTLRDVSDGKRKSNP